MVKKTIVKMDFETAEPYGSAITATEVRVFVGSEAVDQMMELVGLGHPIINRFFMVELVDNFRSDKRKAVPFAISKVLEVADGFEQDPATADLPDNGLKEAICGMMTAIAVIIYHTSPNDFALELMGQGMNAGTPEFTACLASAITANRKEAADQARRLLTAALTDPDLVALIVEAAAEKAEASATTTPPILGIAPDYEEAEPASVAA